MKLVFSVALILMTAICSQTLHAQQRPGGTPSWIRGSFTDDYRITYFISDSLWMQQSTVRFHVLKWNLEENYLIAQNDTANPSEKGLFTRIDFMTLKGMEPFEWGFCLTAYDAVSALAAEKTRPADRANPRKGCNGFPFSRMKRSDAGKDPAR